jgi:prepilin-type N-terminal cleavage/methylation domain-containing protein
MKSAGPHKRRESGVTLIELMVVIVVASVLALAVGRAMTRQDNAAAAGNLARKVWLALRQAHSLAVDTGAITYVRFAAGGRQITVLRESLLGPGPPMGSLPLNVSQEEAGGRARIQTVRAGVEIAPNAAPGTGGLPQITFAPDGSATAATIYVRDGDDTNVAPHHPHKVVVYGLTGLSKHFTRW